MSFPRRVGIHFNSLYERHDTGKNHPESIARYRILREAMEKLPDRFIRLPGRTATVAEILLAHENHYPDLVRADVDRFAEQLRTGDTAISADSYDVALDAAGALLNTIDATMRGEVDRAFCAIRPPGHHATADRGMGFCIFNNVAIAARYLQKKHNLQKIAIIDWDAHHGNGTEAIFATDPSVLYLSLHEDGAYPHTGPADYRGEGEGFGTTLNIPLPTGSDGTYALKAWDRSIEPVITDFAPEFILISAGFDARKEEPICNLKWEDETFVAMTERLNRLSDRFTEGRVISVLEGGYNPQGLASASIAHIHALLEE